MEDREKRSFKNKSCNWVNWKIIGQKNNRRPREEYFSEFNTNEAGFKKSRSNEVATTIGREVWFIRLNRKLYLGGSCTEKYTQNKRCIRKKSITSVEARI